MRINDILVEFAPAGGGDSGNYFQALASAWYNGTFDTGSLQKGIKSQQDVERLLNRGIVCPDGKTRKLHIDYNANFDGVEIYSDDYYEYGDHDDTIDSRTGQKWGPYDFMAFSDEDLSEGLAEGLAQDEAEETSGWRAEFVNEINYNTFEVRLTNARSKESANFIIRPVDMVSYGPTLSIETMDVRDLQTGQTESWTNDDPAPEGPIAYAISGLFYDDKQLQKKLRNIIDTHNTKGQDTLPGLEKRRSIGQEVDADAYVDAGEKTQAAMAKMKQGVAEDSTAHDCKHCNGKGYHTVTKKDGTKVATNCPQCKGKGYIVTKGVAEGLNEFAADDGDSGGEDDALHKYARMWWAGDDATQQQIEKVLARMGWEIGEDEGGYDNGGVFVVRAGDVNGNSYTSWAAEDLTEGVAEGELDEKSTSQAQFRTMAAAAHDPAFAKKVGIKQSVAREFNQADRGQSYKSLPKKATEGASVTTTPGSIEPGGAVDNFKQQMANNTERDMAEGNRKPEPPEADYGDDYQDMVKRVKKLAGLGPLKTQYDPNKRMYRNMPTAVQPKK